MKYTTRIISSLALVLLYSVPSHAFVVHDPITNASVNGVNKSVQGVNDTAREILKVNKDILKTVQKIQDDCEGSSTKDVASLGDLLGDIGLTIDPIPSTSFSIAGNDKEEDEDESEEVTEVGEYMDNLALASNPEKTAADKSYAALEKSVRQTATIIRGVRNQIAGRREAILSSAGNIGKASDIKGAMAANTAAVVQQTMTINEMIGLLNHVLDAQQVQNHRDLTSESGIRKSLTYAPRTEAEDGL